MMAEAPFEKHVYGRERLENFNSHLDQFRVTACEHLAGLFKKICKEHLCIFFDEHNWQWDDSMTSSVLPSKGALRKSVDAFKASLTMSDEAICRVENEIKDKENPLCGMD